VYRVCVLIVHKKKEQAQSHGQTHAASRKTEKKNIRNQKKGGARPRGETPQA